MNAGRVRLGGALVALGLMVILGGLATSAGASADGSPITPPAVDGTAQANGSTEAGPGQASGSLEVTDMSNRTLALRTSRAGPNGISNPPGRVSAAIINRGGERASGTVTLHRVNRTTGAVGPAVDSANVTLDPGVRKRIPLRAPEVLLEGPGRYPLRARLGDSAATGTFRLYYPRDTYFVIETERSPTVRPGEPATIDVRVRNTGHPPGIDTDSFRSPGVVVLAARIDGRTVSGDIQWVDVDEERTVTLAIPADELAPGNTTVEISSASGHDRRLDVLIRSTVTVREADEPEASGPDAGLLAAVAAAAIVAAAVAGRRWG